jgi:hypothetical protein
METHLPRNRLVPVVVGHSKYKNEQSYPELEEIGIQARCLKQSVALNPAVQIWNNSQGPPALMRGYDLPK